MVTPPAIDALFVAWLRDHERTVPTERALAAFVAGLPLVAQRRAARLYAIGFVRGAEFGATLGQVQVAADLATVEDRLAVALAVVRALRGAAPESPV